MIIKYRDGDHNFVKPMARMMAVQLANKNEAHNHDNYDEEGAIFPLFNSYHFTPPNCTTD